MTGVAETLSRASKTAARNYPEDKIKGHATGISINNIKVKRALLTYRHNIQN
jgi:hypothetical protein